MEPEENGSEENQQGSVAVGGRGRRRRFPQIDTHKYFTSSSSELVTGSVEAASPSGR